jgi:hypothetical protein
MVEYARIQQKIDDIFEEYREAGNTVDGGRSTINDPKLVGETAQPAYPRISLQDMFSDGELVSLLQERNRAWNQLSKATQLVVRLLIVTAPPPDYVTSSDLDM